MNLASVESIKSYFDLANMTEEELQEKINELNFTSNLISNSLDRALTVYKSVIGAEAEAQQIQFSDTIELLDSLNDSEGLRLFTYLFGYYENKIFLPAEISLSNIINILSVIDKFLLIQDYLGQKLMDFYYLMKKQKISYLNLALIT